MKVDAARLTLESISPELARRIVARDPAANDAWHAEYPFEDELAPLQGLAADPDPDPVFTMYQIRRRSDGLAVGGLGFFGPPDDSGRVGSSSDTAWCHPREALVLQRRQSSQP